MAEWLYEDGIGERRAALVADGRIKKARIERDGDGVKPGAIIPARLVERLTSHMDLLRAESGEDLITRRTSALTVGETLLVEVTRSAIPEAGLLKRARARPAPPGAIAQAAPSLLDGIVASGVPVRTVAMHAEDALEQAGWSEVADEAKNGHVPFDGGLLRIELTAAMVAVDVDGIAAPLPLAHAAVKALAQALVRHDMTGNIVIDLPTLASKGERIAVADSFDACMPPPFERTAINGYGLLQVIRPRLRPSLFERMQHTPVESAALALLQRAERAQGAGPLTLTAHPAVLRWIGEHPIHSEALQRRIGRSIALQADAGCGIWQFHAQ